MMVYKEGKLIAVINDKSMASMSRDEKFNQVYEGMIKNGIQELEKADSPPGTFATKVVTKKVSPDTIGVVAGELGSLGYRIKIS